MFKAMNNSPSIPEILSSEGKDFLQRCFRRDPAERPSAAMLLEHPFLKSSQQIDVPSHTQVLSRKSTVISTFHFLAVTPKTLQVNKNCTVDHCS